MSIPTVMNALWYEGPGNYEVKEIPIPQYGDYDVLLKVRACGICGTDSYVDKGIFPAAFPLSTGHEVVGEIAALGKNVKLEDFPIGQRCAMDPLNPCTRCFHCVRGAPTYCEKLEVVGVNKGGGGFAEYLVVDAKRLHKLYNVSDEEATLIEPTSCAIRGIDRLRTVAGITALVTGSGPSGLLLAQLLKVNGAQKVVIASNKGIKMDTAKRLSCGDEYVELDRDNSKEQWDKLKKDYPYGFDVVVEATGSTTIANEAIHYVRKGGTLLLYSIYDSTTQVHWSPMQIFINEITITSSVVQDLTFPRAVAYIDSGKLNVKGMVTDVFKINDFQKALEKMNTRKVVKIVMKP